MFSDGRRLRVRMDALDALGAVQLCNKGRALRQAAGTLSGMAAGITPDTPDDDPTAILDRMLAEWPRDPVTRQPLDRWPSADAAVALARAFPAAYRGWTGEQVTKALRSFPPAQSFKLRAGGDQFKGYTFENIAEAHARWVLGIHIGDVADSDDISEAEPEGGGTGE